MFGLLSESMIKSKLSSLLEKNAEENKLSAKEIMAIIKPINEDFDPAIHLYKMVDGKPIYIREIPLSELV